MVLSNYYSWLLWVWSPVLETVCLVEMVVTAVAGQWNIVHITQFQ
jgi:hypothetical protein